MTSLPGPQLVSLLSQGIHHDSTARDLHFLQGESRQSYHQSLLSQFSPLLKEVLEDRLSLGLQEVTVLLDSSLDMASLNLLMDYLYTGRCFLKSRQQAASILELAHLLQLDVSLQLPREDQQVLLPLEEEQSSLKLASPGNPPSVRKSQGDPLFSCTSSRCNKKLLTKNRLYRRMKSHMKEYQIPCEVCNKLFKTQQRLTRHKVAVHYKENVVFTCTFCDIVKSSKLYLEKHITKCHRPKQCPKCDEMYESKLLWQAHNKSCGRKRNNIQE